MNCSRFRYSQTVPEFPTQKTPILSVFTSMTVIAQHYF